MRMTLGKKLWLAIVIPLIFLSALGVIAIASMESMKRTFSRVILRSAPLLANSNRLQTLIIDMIAAERGYIITQKDEFLKPYTEASEEFTALIAKQKGLVAGTPRRFDPLVRIEALVKEWQENAVEPLIALSRLVAEGTVDAGFLQKVVSQGEGTEILEEMGEIKDEILESFLKDGNVSGVFLTQSLATAMVVQVAAERNFLITGQEELLAPFYAGGETFQENIEELRALVGNAYNRDASDDDLDALEVLSVQWGGITQRVIDARREVTAGLKTRQDVRDLIISGEGEAVLNQMTRITDRLGDRFERAGNDEPLILLVGLARSLETQGTGERGFVITGNEEFLEPFLRGQAEFESNLRHCESWIQMRMTYRL